MILHALMAGEAQIRGAIVQLILVIRGVRVVAGRAALLQRLVLVAGGQTLRFHLRVAVEAKFIFGLGQ